ncbi:ABC transporter substrate-binding protein [Croceicoccus mobilis]|uniref:Nitrate transporter n=1 Tax=Croceicoccus mobilis TaxID=1703339 RepID=A0A917DRM6_9SPHN|nr:ABC transporter substrate-binding protein [Croceicoccus mobilis]GGD63483.1 nitrate transporter [Croceicoccus mobilis]
MTQELSVGFLPLVDACLPIIAQEMGFAEEEGLNLTFMRDVSWATVLDRLLYGHSDVAHMLAPLAIATTLGRGRPAQPLAAPFVLGLNGNAITFSNELADKVAHDCDGELCDPKGLGARLRDEALARKAAGKPLRFGVVHRYSSHNYMLRYWLAACGMHPDDDVEIITVAPPFTADALAAGEVDGTCVGEPWNSVAVDRGVGRIVLATAQIWRRGVEKVLAMRESVLDERRESIEALIRAMRRAGEHFVNPANWEGHANLLARPEYLASDPKLILAAISDELILSQDSEPVHFKDFMFQYREAANFPWISQAQWLYTQMVRWDGFDYDPADAEKAGRVFRPDVYRSALRGQDSPLPGASSKVEGAVKSPLGVGAEQGDLVMAFDAFFDGKTFDPEQLEAYLASQT